jgi:hypothetical protein
MENELGRWPKSSQYLPVYYRPAGVKQFRCSASSSRQRGPEPSPESVAQRAVALTLPRCRMCLSGIEPGTGGGEFESRYPIDSMSPLPHRTSKSLPNPVCGGNQLPSKDLGSPVWLLSQMDLAECHSVGPGQRLQRVHQFRASSPEIRHGSQPDIDTLAAPEVIVLRQDCSAEWVPSPATLDAVFTSNFFEHRPSKAALPSLWWAHDHDGTKY